MTARACSGPAPLLLSAMALVLHALSGCISQPTLGELQTAPAPHHLLGASALINDERAQFRRYFCAAFEEHSPANDRECGDWLHKLADEPAEVEAFGRNPVVPLEVLLVTGAFSECFGEDARPFRSAIAELVDTPHSVETIVVGGRSGAEQNATQIARYFDEHPPGAVRPRVLVGYSKGTTDILRFLEDYPGHASSVNAVVSIAGAVYGSPLADLFDGPYHLLFGHLPMSRCEKGDNEVVHSLRTDVRRAWLESVELPDHLRYYSIAAFTTRERLARALVPTWKLLLKHDRRNDGQLLPTDALIPGSSLLGYLNADHWAVAMEIEKELEFFAHRRDEKTFPHTALLKAVLDYVSTESDRGLTRVTPARPAGTSVSSPLR